jgi:hypothetical protein
MKVEYIGDDYEKGVYEVITPLADGYLMLKGKLFEGHKILAGPSEVQPLRILMGVHPIRGGFTTCNLTGPRDTNGIPQFWLYDIDAYPVARHGYSVSEPKFDLIVDHGRVKDCWSILENYDVPGRCSETLCAGWVEMEDGTINYFPPDRYSNSALDKMPKSAYKLEQEPMPEPAMVSEPDHGFEEMTLF